LLETRTPEVEHLRGGFSPELLLYFGPGKRVFKKITFVNFDVLLRKKLFRLAAGVSFHPAVKVDFHGQSTSPFVSI